MDKDKQAIIKILCEADLIVAIVRGNRISLGADIQRDIISSLEQYYNKEKEYDIKPNGIDVDERTDG